MYTSVIPENIDLFAVTLQAFEIFELLLIVELEFSIYALKEYTV
jgi:hypothetical protein